uniref:tetratricopeptide repeat protein n=1 Tax=Thioalkalivibrio sp. ALE9 TaxID=1158169 RepID=UPI00038235A4
MGTPANPPHPEQPEGPSQADQDGFAAFERGDYRTAGELWAASAEAGSAWAQLGMGILYADGLGLEADAERARGYWEQAAAQGLSDASFNLGVMAEKADPTDTEAARHWYGHAAEAGHVVAQNNLAVLLQNAGDEATATEAVQWWQRAAEHGDPDALNSLGVAHQQGSGCARDRAAA